jgi:hypothetical protein
MKAQRIDVPSLPNGRVQKKIPTPFARPSISIGGAGPVEKREWRAVLACKLAEGDIVPGVGVLDTVDEQVTTADDIEIRWTVTVTGGDDNRRSFDGNDQVWAFVPRAAE